MAYDGIVTCAMAQELNEKIYMGKIEKVYQPEADELIFSIYTKQGNVKLYASANSSARRLILGKRRLRSSLIPICSSLSRRKGDIMSILALLSFRMRRRSVL